VGAAFGWKVAVLAFFVAVFIAIAWAIVSALLGRFTTFFKREMPFGPHLAVAAILFVVARPVVVGGIDLFSRSIETVVSAVGLVPEAPGDGGAEGAENPRRMPPAQLAQPSDRR
jgi:hypothetical protein